MTAQPRPPAKDTSIRYAPAERLLRLVRALAATRTGLTLDEMAEEVGVSRRTIERLRDRLITVFPQLDFNDDDERVRRWRLPGSALIGTIEAQPQTVAAVETAAGEAERLGDTDRARLLRDASITLRAVMHPTALRRTEADIAALMEAEGIAMRPGPRAVIAKGVLPVLRQAILAMRCIHVEYQKTTEPRAQYTLCPYGLLYGGRGWLVAHAQGTSHMRLWRLDRIVSAQALDHAFDRDVSFNLKDYAAQSFGVFQEEPVDVVLVFAASAAVDAERWRFHPSQQCRKQPDGSLRVQFRAGGMLEMRNHLFTWGDAVSVVAPTVLRDSLVDQLIALAEHHRREPPDE